MCKFNASFLGGQVMADDVPLALRQVDPCRCLSVSQDLTGDRLIGPSQKWETRREILRASQRLPGAYTWVHNNNGQIMEQETERFLESPP